jgi:serine/threonine-protein kinase
MKLHSSSFPSYSTSTVGVLFTVLAALLFFTSIPTRAGQPTDTIIVSAEGLADPGAEQYQRDKGLMIDELRRDARRQAIEKAVGVYVESSTLVENYLLIEDRVLSRSKGLIKQILEQSSPRLGDDGLMHIKIKAEVFIGEVKNALDTLSRQSRISLIRQHGNPTISVAIVVKDAKRGNREGKENSTIAENILKDRFVDFGYRVWSEDYTKILQRGLKSKRGGRRIADFSVIGEAKFKTTSITLKASGLTITKHVLTSWTVKCIDNHTGEEVYFNNKVPRQKSWADEDQALEDIGKLIGNEFTKDFFESQLMKPSRIYQLQLTGLPDYDTALLFQEEFIGLRSILNAELINFEAGGLSFFEVECTGSGSNFAQIVNNAIIKPINKKLAGPRLRLISHHGSVVTVAVDPGKETGGIQEAIKSSPPASLADAAPERVKKLIQSADLLEKITKMNHALK